MRLSRAALAVVLSVFVLSSGCIANMGDLKEALGANSLPEPPVYEAPLAKAQANATTVLVGAPIRFLSEGSRDPQGLGLSFRWEFGDGAAAMTPMAVHAFAQPGEYLVRLTVVNTEGLSDEDTVAVRVGSLDRAPTAALRVTDAAGKVVERADMGVALSFEAIASDPEGQPLSYEWDFGDGATSHDAKASHAYAAPGVYDVKVQVTDKAGQTARASTRVLVDGAWKASGAFGPAGANAAQVPVPVAAGAQRLEARLAFPGGFGVNDLVLVLLDPDGNEVARSQGATPPGAQDAQARTLVAAGAALAKPGQWTLEVQRASGVSVEWTLEARETL